MAGVLRAEDDAPSPRRNKRPRVLVACQRCKSRRQKCDNASPACSNCARSGVSCVYAENAYPSSYVKMLEDRLGMLEAQLGSPSQVSEREELHSLTQPSRARHNPTLLTEQPTRSSPSNRLTLGLGVLSSVAAAEPHYFGSSSGLSLAHFVQAAIESGTHDGSEVSLPLLADRPFSNHAPSSQTPLAPIPAPKVGSRYIRAYLASVHPLYPFLDRRALWESQRQHSSFHADSSPDSRLDLAVLHLVYAIGSRCLELLGSTNVAKHTPQGHFLAAMKYVPEAMTWTSIRSIEVTLLLGLHSMRSPSGTSVWHLCGLALRQCLELGLHKQRVVPPHQLVQDQKRKRLFWSAFIFERKTALVLGRPFAISDKEIDADLPLEVNDDEEDIEQLDAARQAQPSSGDTDSRHTSMSLHRYHILLYRIHTKIRFTLHALKNSHKAGKLRDKIALRFQELEEWKGCVLDHYSKTELLLEYNKARRSLLQPLMTEGQGHYTFGPPEYAACVDASGQICQLYRRLHRLSPVPFTLRDLHAVFVAGFTLIYCICNRPSLYDAHRAADIGACSTVLYVISEQWTSARKYRDAFEMVVEKMIERTRSAAQDQAVLSNDTRRDTRSTKPRRQRGAKAHRAQPDPPDYLAPPSGPAVHNAASYVDQEASRTQEQADIGAGQPLIQASFGSPRFADDLTPSALDGFGFGLDLDFEYDEIGNLLTNEGLDWFTDAVL
ncbi:fungal-specific transcription factor domain-containing protein [Exophiala viscosa]|uniref:fungal-specific transcription factor domain-containing protein n=1 Tax=Exophiala viscosa TaxID=2486360 RepID=UPI00218D7C1A|nr:fungal-specific transcription factor domain-containing protein [Exophiala viscosa]